MASDVTPLSVVKDCDDRPEIKIDHELSTLTDKGARSLALDGSIYQRGGALVHVVTPTPSPGERSVPLIRDLPIATLRVRLAQVARWIKWNGKVFARVAVPESITQAIHSRGQWDDVRPLTGVLTAPTLRPDGSVLQVAGYDVATALLLWPSEAFIEVPERPSREDARGAADAILDLVVDFPFATEADRSAWLSSVLTLVGRHTIAGPCPLFAVDANTRGSGKSRLVDVATMLAQGRKAARSSLSNVDEETRKQISSLLARGEPSTLIDNVRSGGPIGSAAFDALLTSDVWVDRNLGKIATIVLPARTVWFATGNNIRFVGDLPRRTLRIRLESPLEDPENRSGFKHGEGDALLVHVARHRRRLVTQALIVLRAHAAAGYPECGRSWGSYEEWSKRIASAIRWIGLPNPLEARATEDESADEDRLHISALMGAMRSIARPLTAREIIGELYPSDRFDHDTRPDLFPTFAPARDAIEATTGARGTPDVSRLGRFLKRIAGRVVDGRSIVGSLDRHMKVQRWEVRERNESPS